MPTKITGTVSGEPLIEVEIGGVYVPWKQGIGNWCQVTAITGSPTKASYTDANGVAWTSYQWTGSGSVTLTSGIIDALVVGGGGGSPNSWAKGGGGGVRWGTFAAPSGVHAVTRGNGGAGGDSYGDGSWSGIGSILKVGGGQAGWQLNSRRNALGGGGSSGGLNTTDGAQNHNGGGAGGNYYGSNDTAGIPLSISGTEVYYGCGGGDAQSGPGKGGTNGSAGTAGVVIIRVPTPFALA